MTNKTVPNSIHLQPSPIRISRITPNIDCASTPIKRIVGDTVVVSAEIVATSPLVVGAAIRYRAAGGRNWEREPLVLESEGLDLYAGNFEVDGLGQWRYGIEAWVDYAETWRRELRRRRDGNQADIDLELAAGNRRFGTDFLTVEEAIESSFEDRQGIVRSSNFFVEVDPELARFGAWYELFPRSFGGFTGLRKELSKFADLGFDVLYLPPIHPIGVTNRKGANNSLISKPTDPGSPWAIGDPSGGHTSIHPDLGTIDEFDLLVVEAKDHGIAIALDLALQCSPDHPWLTEYPEWFAWREDGTVQFAENPPKRYEDIVNFNFDSPHWRKLWDALFGVVRFWIDHGVEVFRVDNPHTKPLQFWEWLITEIRTKNPNVFFLAEAFTRPALMSALAKVGFSQSYTYFTWRNTREELTSYMSELTGEMHEYFRPNFFVNTPDILSSYLQKGGAPAFAARAVLAATLSPSYGIYSGFENYENEPMSLNSEEYLNSEKYEIKLRRMDGPLLPTIARLNQIRRSSSVFKRLDNIRFVPTASDHIIAYIKHNEEPDPGGLFIVCVNLDTRSAREGLIEVPMDLHLPAQFPVLDVLGDNNYQWTVGGNYVRLDPGASHVLRVG